MEISDLKIIIDQFVKGNLRLLLKHKLQKAPQPKCVQVPAIQNESFPDLKAGRNQKLKDLSRKAHKSDQM